MSGVKSLSLSDFLAIYDRIASVVGSSRQKDIALALGMTAAHVNNLLAAAKGKNLSKGPTTLPYKQLIDWASANEISVDWLLFGVEPPEKIADQPDGKALINLPEEDPRPLIAPEREIIEKTLVVLRSPGLDNEPDVTLLNTINALHSLVRQQRSAIDGPDGRGGAGRAAGKRGSAREKAAAAAGGARK